MSQYCSVCVSWGDHDASAHTPLEKVPELIQDLRDANATLTAQLAAMTAEREKDTQRIRDLLAGIDGLERDLAQAQARVTALEGTLNQYHRESLVDRQELAVLRTYAQQRDNELGDTETVLAATREALRAATGALTNLRNSVVQSPHLYRVSCAEAEAVLSLPVIQALGGGK